MGPAATGRLHPMLCRTVETAPLGDLSPLCHRWELLQLPSSCPTSRFLGATV